MSLTGAEAAQAGALVVFKDSCDAATSPVIVYLNDLRGVGLSVNVSKVMLNWDRRGIFAVQTCADTALVDDNAIVVPVPCDDAHPDPDWSGWYGRHELMVVYVDVLAAPPALDINGLPTCEYAQGMLGRIMQAEFALTENKTVRWGERLLTRANYSELIALKREWQNTVTTVCGRGANRRRPLGVVVGTPSWRCF